MTLGQIRDLRCLEFLLTNQNSDGGWGYHPALHSAVEATASVLLALNATHQAPAEACARARTWLVQAQRTDGSWPAFPGQPQGCWVTSIASHALHLQGGARNAVERGHRWLLNEWPAESALWWRVRQTLFSSRATRQNSSLCGWNWTPGTASWVEPTAHALLFLRSLPANMHTSQGVKRRQSAERMLYDRMCPGGGWNSGNPLVYGVAGVPRVGPTAWALLALGEDEERAEIQMSLNWLQGAHGTIHGAASLALAYRCLTAYGRRVSPLAPALGKLYPQNRFFENVLTNAWIILALNEVGNMAVPTAGKAAIR
ncbi:MAG TPA: prenyltransferase/squalene oxidase repeat-containing protein [Terriglobia bacterium]|nr:prenyltransferase/squalene oxidase repeat-containing protein [Terriglobia bacterium]